MAGLVVVRLDGPGSLPVWLLILAGVAAVVPFARYEDARRDPIVDVRLMRSPGQWPVQLTAFLFGMSVLGAQIPLSTFARTDPAVAGYAPMRVSCPSSSGSTWCSSPSARSRCR